MKKRYLQIIIFFTVGMLMGKGTGSYYKLPSLEFTDLDYGFPMQTIQLGNIDLAYIDQGEGPETILMIHGLGSYARAWTKNIEVLAKTHRVIAVDLPGYGHSSKGYYEYSMSFNADVLRTLIDTLGVGPVTLAGHSMGGQIAMTLALESPELVKGLVLISPAGFERFNEGESAWMKNVMTPELVRDTPVRAIAQNVSINFYAFPEDASWMITDRIQLRGASDFYNYCFAVSKNVEGMLRGIVWDRLDQISQPTLVLFGANDALIPNRFLHPGWTKDIAEIAHEIPNAQVNVIPKCGHFVQLDAPDVANQLILDFLKGARTTP
ncbi:MAG: alpha/beta fold hydrolase [Candidatus Marinimicrobia bacterium]|nr:alpha/beta fold hydrolase [Candidatus Neomarinimicrobiota bacterium]